jgi:serine/threonine protein kinase
MDCPEGKIRNPKNGRYVKIDGKVGKEILKNRLHEFETIKKIGEGGFGKINLIKDKKTGKKYVEKTGKTKHMKIQYDILRELHDKNLVTFLNPQKFEHINRVSSRFVMNYLEDYMTIKQLKKKIRQKEIKFSNKNYKTIYYTLLKDIQNLHQSHYVHNDIKSENVMVKIKIKQQKTIDIEDVKLIDYGLMIKVEDSTKKYKLRGCTFKYMNTKTLLVDIPNANRFHLWERGFKENELKENDMYAFHKIMYRLKTYIS